MEHNAELDALLTHIDDIWKLAFSKCGNTQDADDLVQETYLAALTAIHNGKPIAYPRTWLARTLMNIWNGQLRRKYRLPTMVSVDCSLIEADIPEDEPTEEEQINLKRCIASLTSLYRQVIVMHYIGGLSVTEIAELLNVCAAGVPKHIPAATAHQAYSRAFSGFEAAVFTELYHAGFHLKDVDFCCPPAVLVIR